MDKSKQSNPNPDDTIVEVIKPEDFVAFNDASCSHPQPWTRDETEELGNAMSCANPNCYEIFMM